MLDYERNKSANSYCNTKNEQCQHKEEAEQQEQTKWLVDKSKNDTVDRSPKIDTIKYILVTSEHTPTHRSEEEVHEIVSPIHCNILGSKRKHESLKTTGKNDTRNKQQHHLTKCATKPITVGEKSPETKQISMTSAAIDQNEHVTTNSNNETFFLSPELSEEPQVPNERHATINS